MYERRIKGEGGPSNYDEVAGDDSTADKEETEGDGGGEGGSVERRNCHFEMCGLSLRERTAVHYIS